MRKCLGVLTALPVCIFLLAGCADSSSPEEELDAKSFYRENVLRIVVGFNPGGGFDEYARMVGAELARRTGGTVVVENQPGGGGLLALNRLVQGSTNGLTIMLAPGEGAILAQLTNRPGTRFDIRQLNWLGRVQKDTPVVLWSLAKPVADFAEMVSIMQNDGSKWGATGLTDNISDAESAMGQALGMSIEQLGIVLGYSGSSESALAALRGEVDGVVVSSTSAANYVGSDTKEGLVAVATLDHERDMHFFPDVPTIYEVAELSEEGKWWVDFRAQVTALGRSFVAHGDVKEERVAYLRAVLQGLLTDEEFIAEAKRRNRPLNYLSFEEQEKVVADILTGLTKERVEEVKFVLTEKYIR